MERSGDKEWVAEREERVDTRESALRTRRNALQQKDSLIDNRPSIILHCDNAEISDINSLLREHL